MGERPILMSAPMVRAILDGTKTQTRRAIRKQFAADAEPAEVAATSPEGWQISGHSGLWWDDAGACIDDAIRCPFGQPGDRLWVRETCRAEELPDWTDGVRYLADDGFVPIENTEEAAEQWVKLGSYGMKFSGSPECRVVPSIHMPRWASRLLLEITGVRVERLQDISEADARAEGCQLVQAGGTVIDRASDQYAALWETINGPGSWDANPWVWVVEFKRVTP